MFSLNCNGKLVRAETPLVMGIMNVTPDSFHAESRFEDDAGILRQAEKMLQDGADMLDIGGQSTRPGAVEVGEEEELRRVTGAIDVLRRRFPEAIISVDTWYARVAAEAVGAGAHIVNDISGGMLDAAMLETVGALGVPYVCMHMRGRPSNMNTLNQYEDLALAVMDHFTERLAACHAAGVRDVILDPGFGFAKNGEQNLELLHSLGMLKIFGRPLLIGLSRKSVVYKTLGITAGEALNGTTVLNTISLLNGADILRVHDVKEAKQAILLTEAYKSKNPGR